MNRSAPLHRSGSLARGGPLARSRGLHTRTALERHKPVRPVSKKRQREMRERRAVIQALYPDRPLCSVPWCVRWADDIHETLTRGRGGSITDPDIMAPVCRACHDEITFTEPGWAYDLGLLRHSWDGAPLSHPRNCPAVHHPRRRRCQR